MPRLDSDGYERKPVAPLSPSQWIRSLLKSIGPGVITGAADDDPSGIATYSIAGAQLGTKLLWTALITWPLMAAVQMMCARIGKVTGQGLVGSFKQLLLAPFLLVAILIVAADKKLMQGQPSSRLGWVVVAVTTIAMFAAGVAMFVV